MVNAEVGQIVDSVTQRIRAQSAGLEGIKDVVVVPHSVAGHYVCRVQLEPLADRRAFKKLFNGTAVGDSIYFTERMAPVAEPMLVPA